MSYLNKFKAELGSAKRKLDISEEISRLNDLLKKSRSKEKESRKTLKKEERELSSIKKSLKNSCKSARGEASNSVEAVRLSEKTDSLHNELIALRKEESELNSLKEEALEWDKMSQFYEAKAGLNRQLKKAALELDATWERWHQCVINISSEKIRKIKRKYKKAISDQEDRVEFSKKQWQKIATVNKKRAKRLSELKNKEIK